MSYLFLSVLGYPLKWAKTRGGYCVEWLGMETDYTNYKLGMSKKRADWLANWLGEKSNSGKVAAKEMQQGLGRVGFAAIASSSCAPSTPGRRLSRMLRVLLT